MLGDHEGAKVERIEQHLDEIREVLAGFQREAAEIRELLAGVRDHGAGIAESLAWIKESLAFTAFCQGLQAQSQIQGTIPLGMQKALQQLGEGLGIPVVIAEPPKLDVRSTGALTPEEVNKLNNESSGGR